MADQLDDRPVFTIVMGCNGAGKSAWKRENYDRLPRVYLDQDSIAGGIGDWNTEHARLRTRDIVADEVAKAVAARVDFGIESTYSGRPGRAMVERAKREGYRVEGVYIGTQSPEINAERVEHRVASHTGHSVDVRRLPERYRFSLSNLRKTAEQFDDLEIVDNSGHDARRRPRPVDQLRLEKGVVSWRADQLEPWCEDWLMRFEQSLADRSGSVSPRAAGGDGAPGGSAGGDAPADGDPGSGRSSAASDDLDIPARPGSGLRHTMVFE